MFIREKLKNAKGKKKYVQHQLIESIRTFAGPRQNIVLNMGFLPVPKDKWKELANAIEGLLLNQSLLFSRDPDIESKAQHYAGLIRKQRLAKASENQEQQQKPVSETEQYESLDVNSLTNTNSKTVGPEHVALCQMQEYGFEDILHDLDFTDAQTKHAVMLLVARMIHPASERETARWLEETSGIKELVGVDAKKVHDTALHRVAVKLWEHHEVIEERLGKKARELFSLKETVILYDLTNTYFEGSKKKSGIAKYGKSKERRNDCPLVTLSLTVDEEGFPKQSKVWNGNVSEPQTLEHILNGLREAKEPSLFPKKKTIVLDAGIASEDNLTLIKERKHSYIAVSRKKTYVDSFWQNATEETMFLADDKTMLKMKAVQAEGETFLLCHSEAKEQKEKAIISRKMQKYEEELVALNQGLKKKRTQKKYEKIFERIGRIKERYGVGNLYNVVVTEKNGNATDITFQKNDQSTIKEKAIGTYVLRTNRADLSGAEISKIHRSLVTIEDCFENMKSALGLRPNFHHTDAPTIAHVHITVLAYHMLAGILKKLRTAGIHYKWTSIRNILKTHTLVTTTMNTKDNHVFTARTCTVPTEKQHMIYNKLKIKQTPLSRISVKTSMKPQRCSAENLS